MSKAPVVPYWHLWVDADGVSHLSACELREFTQKSMQAPAAPQWQGRKLSGAMTTFVTVQPIGWIGDWHENPKPQWILPLSGRWFVEAMDGARREFGAGELSFGGDQACRIRDRKRGHRSGTLGDAPAVLMVVQFDAVDAGLSPCVFE